ncbi:MAG: flagellar basal body rod protein FlgC [Pseudomonadota bacterium]
MDFLTALNISSSGLSAQRIRMNVISANLANIETTRTPEGGHYRRKDVVFAATPAGDPFGNMLESRMEDKVRQVEVLEIYSDNGPPRLKYDPSHPDANDKGYVAMPNITVIGEMINMLSATRSYEANVTAINATKNMALKALEIGNV